MARHGTGDGDRAEGAFHLRFIAGAVTGALVKVFIDHLALPPAFLALWRFARISFPFALASLSLSSSTFFISLTHCNC